MSQSSDRRYYERAVFGVSHAVGSGNLLFGGEVYHDDGPWKSPDDYLKFNGLLTYSRGDDAKGLSVTASAYHGNWNSSDQIAANAVPLVGFFGTLNPTDGGNSGRYSLQAEWHRQRANSVTKITAYGFHYDLDLFSDFTYYLTDPVHGDQFEQQDKRWVVGLDARHTIPLRNLRAQTDRVNVAHYSLESLQVAALSRRHYSVVRSLVFAIPNLVGAHGRDGCRAWAGHFGELHLALGSGVRSGTGQALPSALEKNKPKLAAG
jgi:hypothetical protein